MKKYIQILNNDYLQGAIFLANLVSRPIIHSRKKKSLSVGRSIFSEIVEKKQSDTLFILGSGATILELDQNRLRHIEQHDSVGFNFWLLHKLVPTYYTVEFLPDSQRSNLLWKNLELRAQEYRQTPIIFKHSKTLVDQWDRIPVQLEKLYVSNNMSVPGSTENIFRRWLQILDKFGILTGNVLKDVVLYKQASLSWLITFALRLDYKKIVLLGVDLNAPDYFYELDRNFCEARGLVIPPSEFSTSVHPTFDPGHLNQGMSISTIIEIFNKVVLKKKGVELFIGSEKSALYSQLPLYPWAMS